LTRVDHKRLLGNFGASHVAARLSATCLVRPVIADTDIGIDLYCESVKDESPFLHFWIQVKAGQQCKERGKGVASCRFETKHLQYWERQPVPVFAALVPVEWPIQRVPPVYVANLTQLLVAKKLRDTNMTTVTSDCLWPVDDPDAVERFVHEIVPQADALRQCQGGVVCAVPTPTPEYVRHYPTIPIGRFQKAILNQIRTTAAVSIIIMHETNTLGGRNTSARRQLAAVICQFDSDAHWENYMAVALSLHADSEYEDAIPWYERARDSIQRDKKVAHLPEWKRTVRIIRKQIAKARRRESA